MKNLRFSLASDSAIQLLEEVGDLLESADIPPELLQRVVNLFKAPAKVFGFDLDRSAALGAGEYRVLLKPSDAFLDLLVALRARKRDLHVAI
jgi:hypothetical protein